MEIITSFVILFYIALVVLYIALIFESVKQAEKKQISNVLVGVVSLLCTPILGFLLVIASPLSLKEQIKLVEINQILKLESKGLVYIEKQDHEEALYYFKAAMKIIESSKVEFIKSKYHTYINSIIHQLEDEIN